MILIKGIILHTLYIGQLRVGLIALRRERDSVTLVEILFRYLIKYLTPLTSTRRDRSFVPHELASPRLGSNPSPLSQNTIDQHIRVGLIALRRERDSNPRGAFTPGGFQDRCLQPLSHPSSLFL